MGVYKCANCDYATDERDDLPTIDDLPARIDSDDIMGAGQCPECGNMVFDTTGRNHRASDVFDELVTALDRLLAAFSVARGLAIAEPMAASELVMELQTSGGAQYAAQDALAKARC